MPKIPKKQEIDTPGGAVCTIQRRQAKKRIPKDLAGAGSGATWHQAPPTKPLFYTNFPESIETGIVQAAPPAAYPDLLAISHNRKLTRSVKRPLPPAGQELLDRPAIRYAGEAAGETPAQQYAKAFTISEIPRCAGLFLTGRCGGSHKHLKAILCCKEWCPDCGAIDSMAHRRRIHRWHAKVECIKSLGYMVITIPAELREHYTSQAQLSEFRTYIKRKLQRVEITGKCTERRTPYSYIVKSGKYKGKRRAGVRKEFSGYMRGLMRWHYAGDCKKCKGEGCEECKFTGAGWQWHPHLNILIEEGFIAPPVLNKFKKEITNYFRKKHESTTAKAVVNYSYRQSAAEKAHTLRYVTRATLRIYKKEHAERIHGYHGGSTWGRWEDAKAKAPTSHSEAYERGACMHCLEDTGELTSITWAKEKLNREQAQKIIRTYNHKGDGYYVGFTDLPFTD